MTSSAPPSASLNEPLLAENPNRFSIFPIEHRDMWDMYKKQMAVFWIPEEVDLTKDIKDWDEKLNDNERYFVKHVLAFFANSDGIVMENLMKNFSNEVEVPEARFFYAAQNMIESVHCVAGETKILTDKGYFEIVSLKDQLVNVWNGEEFSEVKVVQTSPEAKLLKVKLSNGMVLDCTEEHKWFIRKGPEAHPETCKIEKVFTKDLKVGEIVGKYQLPILDIEDPDEFRNPYTHGFFCGDGSYNHNCPWLMIYGDKKPLLKYLEVNTISHQPNQDRIACSLFQKVNKDKYVVPTNYSKKTKLEWLAGFLDADGCVKTSAKGLSAIQVTSIDLEFLRNIQLMLTTLGVCAPIRKNKDAQKRFMPDGKGGVKEYQCQEIWCLYISVANTHKLVTQGFTPHRLTLITADVVQNAQHIRVEEIIDEGRKAPTYCFTEPKKHAGVFNGILTGQSESYALMIDTYIRDKDEKLKLLRAIHNVPCVEKKAAWAMKWMDPVKRSFAHRVLAFSVVEGVHFSASFCAIFWLKKRGLMPGLCQANLLISRDEGLHTEFACLLYSKLVNKLPVEEVHAIIKEAVEIEVEFITESIPCNLIGMNSELMIEYIKYVADRHCVQLGYPKIYDAKCEFSWMEMISLNSKTNFFDQKETSYSKANTLGKQEDKRFAMDADF